MPGGREQEHLKGSSEITPCICPSASLCRDIDEPPGKKIVNLISQRYITPGKQFDDPSRSYVYVKGQLQIYEGRPELVITLADQIWDGPPK